MLSSELAAVDRAVLLLEIATDEDEPPLTDVEVASLAGTLLRHAATEEWMRLALEVCEPMATDLAEAASVLLECAEAAAPEGCLRLRQLEALGRSMERLGRR